MTKNAKSSVQADFKKSVVGFQYDGLETANSHRNKANQGSQSVKFKVTDVKGKITYRLMSAAAVEKRLNEIKDKDTVSVAQKAEFSKAIAACKEVGLLPKPEVAAKARVIMSA